MKPDRMPVELPDRLAWKHTTRAGAARRPGRGTREVSVGTRPESPPRPPPPRTVLVPLDGTPAAERGLPYALAVARRAGAEVAPARVYSTLQAANRPELLGWHAGDGPRDTAHEPPLGRVLVPLDGSARPERALGPAGVLAALARAGASCPTSSDPDRPP